MKPWEYGTLRVSENQKYLCNGNRPFFWLGDTAWLLFSRLNEKEAEVYLQNRKEKGYNVILATLIHEWHQTTIEGIPALADEDAFLPDSGGLYWKRVEAVVDLAEQMGMYMALLPCWGNHVSEGRLNTENFENYLGFLAEHFGKKKNIIWIMGGDVKGSAAYEMFCQMGQYMKAHCTQQLVAFHPFGRTSSSQWFQQETWLDFYLFQSGHRRYDQKSLGAWDDNGNAKEYFGEDNWRYVQRDLEAEVKKPTLDGEPSYEQILQGLHDQTQPYWQAWDTRRYAYWSVLAGACGHTFGDNSIMQFFIKERDKEGAFGVWQDWTEAIHNCGGAQMGHLRALMEEIHFETGSARQDLTEARDGYERVSVFAGPDWICCYSYSGAPFELYMTEYEGDYECRWIDPVTGVRSRCQDVTGGKVVAFCPPKKLEGHSDWVLLLEKRKD